MQPTIDDWQNWEKTAVLQFGRAVRDARDRTGLSQRALAEAAGVDRGQIANIESVNKSDGSPRLSELPKLGVVIRLARALKVPPVLLLYPDYPDGEVEVMPGLHCRAEDAARWFSGEDGLSGWLTSGKLQLPPVEDHGVELMETVRERRKLGTLENGALRMVDSLGGELSVDQQRQLDDLNARIDRLDDRIQAIKVRTW